MSRRTDRLTLDNLATLPGPCRTCLFWEMDPVRRARVADEDEAYAEKETWVSTVLRDWGSCGQLAMVDDEAVGYVIYAPSVYVPGSANLPTAPVSVDALQMTTVYVDPDARGGGIGRLLIQGMARDLISAGRSGRWRPSGRPGAAGTAGASFRRTSCPAWDSRPSGSIRPTRGCGWS